MCHTSFQRSEKSAWEPGKSHSRSPIRFRSGQALHYAPPDFLLGLVAVGKLYPPFPNRKGAYVALSSAAWQEIRVRSGRDDNFAYVQEETF